MSETARKIKPPPACASLKIAEEFAFDLYAAKVDNSDDEECCEYLMDLYPDRIREIIPNLDRAIYEAGQIAIEVWIQKYGDVQDNVAREMARITQDN